MKKIRVYIAFSVTGTNAFITATKLVTKSEYEVMVNLARFQPVESRRPDYKPEDGIKLHWSELLTTKHKPMRAPAEILRQFDRLAALGWAVDKDKFVRRHYRERRVNSEHRAVQG